MPTILTIGNKWRIMIRVNDHLPPHVHIEGGSGLSKSHAKVDLETFEFYQVKNCTRRELKLILLAVMKNKNELLQAWRKIHG